MISTSSITALLCSTNSVPSLNDTFCSYFSLFLSFLPRVLMTKRATAAITPARLPLPWCSRCLRARSRQNAFRTRGCVCCGGTALFRQCADFCRAVLCHKKAAYRTVRFQRERYPGLCAEHRRQRKIRAVFVGTDRIGHLTSRGFACKGVCLRRKNGRPAFDCRQLECGLWV